MPEAAPFGSLDFLYVPSRDVAEDLRWFGAVLGGLYQLTRPEVAAHFEGRRDF